MNQKIDWRNRTNVGFVKGFVGFYEGAEEILACSYNYNVALVGCANRIIAGFGCSSVYLYPVLIVMLAKCCQGMGGGKCGLEKGLPENIRQVLL